MTKEANPYTLISKMVSLKKTEKYFKQHPFYNASVHFLGGIGLGILMTYPFIGNHPVRWGGIFLLLAILGHLYPTLKH